MRHHSGRTVVSRCLAANLIEYPELGKRRLRRKPAGRPVVNHRLRQQYRAPERVGAGNIGHRCTLAHHDADAHPRDVNAIPADDFAFLRKVIDRLGRSNHDVCRDTFRHTLANRRRVRERYPYCVPALPVKRLGSGDNARLYRTDRQQIDVHCACRRGIHIPGLRWDYHDLFHVPPQVNIFRFQRALCVTDESQQAWISTIPLHKS